MPKSKTPRSTAKKMVARTTASGAQQYTRGKDATERVIRAGDAVLAAKSFKAKQMLLRAQRDEMGSGARASSSQAKEMEKLRSLARGRSSAAIGAKIKGPNVAAKSAYNRMRVK